MNTKTWHVSTEYNKFGFYLLFYFHDIQNKMAQLVDAEKVDIVTVDLTAFVKKIRRQCESIPSVIEFNSTQELIEWGNVTAYNVDIG